MFGKKSKLERVKADARADYLKCAALDGEDRLHRVFSSRIAQRARLNLDKIFVQGAKAEEQRQVQIAEAIKAGKELPPRIIHEGYNQLQGVSGSVVSWVPEELANKMFNLGADYQTTQISAHEALQQADKISEAVIEDLQTTQIIQLLSLLREESGGDELED
ncbi:MAG: hypothetical protein CMD33_07590 [Flavobacteriales bacterium]|jgi:hypothetical protein|nr:hypothetical protein [Flavobacteriales bacterium]|tara:strand:- start:159 stop:644 length:486 start_codon:yes stop_codon:yes gene_type:complete